MNHIALRFFVLILLVLGFFVNTQAVDFSELDKLVPEELKQKNTPGAVIVVISGDKLVYQKAFGVANVETNAPMQTEMLFRLGSTTKMFTAAALVALSEKDKIKLNEPIGTRVKGLDPKNRRRHTTSSVE
jgi:CubicO group peptidase (beta-lactamase class C family)